MGIISIARAKGLIELRVVIVHGLRNSLIPVVTSIEYHDPVHVRRRGRGRAGIHRPGLGSPDGPIHQRQRLPNDPWGITVVIAAAVLIGNVLTDTVYSLLDPKIREPLGGERNVHKTVEKRFILS